MIVIDALAARYGWLPEQIYNIHWSIADTAIRRQADDYKLRYVTAAFTAFLLGAAGEGKRCFRQYQQDIGLIQSPKKAKKSEAELIAECEAAYQRYLKQVGKHETV